MKLRMLTVAIVAFAVGELDPIGLVYWRIAATRLPQMKAESLAAASPFESIPHARWIGESARAFAVDDIHPQAPVHFLVIPKQRIPTLLDAPPDLVAEMIGLARDTAVARDIAADGFRLVVNTNPRGAQSVYHLHMHVLGGRQMRWPPG